MRRGDKSKLFILFVPLFTLSVLSKIVCSLWSGCTKRNTLPVESCGLAVTSASLNSHRKGHMRLYDNISTTNFLSKLVQSNHKDAEQ